MNALCNMSNESDMSDFYLSWTWLRIGQSCFRASSESSQSCKINFTILWVFWSTDEIILQSFSASLKCSWFCVSVKSRAEQQEKSSLLWRAERRTSAAICWRSEELQQRSSFSNSSLSTLNHTQILLTNTHVLLNCLVYYDISAVISVNLSCLTLLSKGRKLSSSSSGMEVQSRLSLTVLQCCRVKRRAAQWTESNTLPFRLMSFPAERIRLDTYWGIRVS